MSSPPGPPAPGPLLLGRGRRLASVLGPLRALAGEAGAPAPTQHADLLDLLPHGAPEPGPPGGLLLDLDELPAGDVGLVERLRAARPGWALSLVGGDPAGTVARTLLARPRTAWYPWPLDVEQLRRLAGGPADGLADDAADAPPAEPVGTSQLELDAGVPSAGPGPRPVDDPERPRPHPLAPTPSRSPFESGPVLAPAARPAGSAAPGRTALEEIEAILGGHGDAPPEPLRARSAVPAAERRPDPFDSAGPEAFLDAPDLVDPDLVDPDLVDPDLVDPDLDDPVLDVFDDPDPAPAGPGGASPAPARRPHEAPGLDLPDEAGVAPALDPEDDFGYPVDDELDDPLDLGPLTLDEEELAFLTAATPEDDGAPEAAPAPAPRLDADPARPLAPPPGPEDERAPRWYRDQVADLADMTQRLELALLRAREAIDETSPEEDVREVEDLQQDVLRLGQFTRTLGYIAAPPGRGSQQLDLSVLLEELLAGLPTQLRDTPRLMFRGAEGCLVRSDKSLLGLAFDALLVVAARAAGADEVLRTSVTPGVDRHEVRIAFPPGALSGRSPGDLLLPYALHRLLPGVGPNAVPAAGGILTGQGGDLALERGDDGLLAFVVHLPAEGVAPAATPPEDGPAAFGPFG